MTRRGPLVLMYHGIAQVPATEDPHNLFVPPRAFRAQLVALREAGFEPLDLDGYLAVRAGTRSRAARQVLLTFDDGYVSMLDDAAPLLKEAGFPALCFISAGLLGDRSHGMPNPSFDLMDADQVRSLPAHGISVGVHGWTHDPITALPANALRTHTEQARDHLGALLGSLPAAFAYPYGEHDVSARTAVQNAGYQVGFATYDGTGPMAIPRVDVNATDTRRSFSIKLQRWYPAARRTLGTIAPARSLAHRLIGSADRGTQSSNPC